MLFYISVCFIAKLQNVQKLDELQDYQFIMLLYRQSIVRFCVLDENALFDGHYNQTVW